MNLLPLKGREKKIYEQQQLDNFNQELRTELLGNGLNSFSMKQQMDKLSTVKNPTTGLSYTPNEARSHIIKNMQTMAVRDENIHRALIDYANSPAPAGIAPEGVTNAEFFPEVAKALDNVLQAKDTSRGLQEVS